jgi:hypothetical protein
MRTLKKREVNVNQSSKLKEVDHPFQVCPMNMAIRQKSKIREILSRREKSRRHPKVNLDFLGDISVPNKRKKKRKLVNLTKFSFHSVSTHIPSKAREVVQKIYSMPIRPQSLENLNTAFLNLNLINSLGKLLKARCKISRHKVVIKVGNKVRFSS